MKDLVVTITPRMISEQLGLSDASAEMIVRDLKYAGQFIAMSDGKTITVFLPDTETKEFKAEKELFQTYEKQAPSKEEISRMLMSEGDDSGSQTRQ